jgi:hypothetical protein
MADTLDKDNWCLRLNSKNRDAIIGHLNTKISSDKNKFKGYEPWYYGMRNGEPFFNDMGPFAKVIKDDQLTTLIE